MRMIAPKVIITCSFMVALATISLALRLYARIGITKNVGVDDAVLLVAWTFQVICAAFIIAETQFGLGKHLDTISLLELEEYLKMLFGSILSYNVSIALVKVSILLQYQRFLYTNLMKNLCRVILVFISMYGIITVVTTITICLPVGSFWDVYHSPHCLDREALWLTHASINIVSDFVIILLPIPVILKLTLPTKQKYGLVAIFAVGIVVCLISIIRLDSVKEAAKLSDVTWSGVHAGIWSQSEISISIVCASLPGMKPLIRTWTGHSSDTVAEIDGNDATAGRRGASDKRESEPGIVGLGAIADGVVSDGRHNLPSPSPSEGSSESPLSPERSPLEEMDEKTIYTQTSSGLIIPVHIP